MLCLSGCFTRRIAEKMGISGWFRADVPGASDYRGRFAKVGLADAFIACSDALGVQGDPAKPIVVLVHGVGGDGPEMEAALPPLIAWEPSALYMFRWVPYDERDEVAPRLALGLSRLAKCAPERKIVVIAHSAGGVISSFAASLVNVGDRAPIDILTVASPLAGTVRRAGNTDGSQEATLMLDLGSRISGYPPAAPGVHVVHLRTHAPADHIMAPSGDLSPNDPSIGVPGAPQVELPGELGHSEALQYVVEALIAGRAAQWLASP